MYTSVYHAKSTDFSASLFTAKRHTPNQQALSDLVSNNGKKRFSNADADTLLEWADEYNFPARDDRGKGHWKGGEHIHIGPRHVPVTNP